MRIAAAAIGSALLGTSVVLLGIAPPVQHGPQDLKASRAATAAATPTWPPTPTPTPTPTPPSTPPATEEQAARYPTLTPARATVLARSPPCPGPTPQTRDPAGWAAALEGEPVGDLLVRGAALSVALPAEEAIAGALVSRDPARRELAALLLNVASERVPTCTPAGADGRTAVQALDELDRAVALPPRAAAGDDSPLELARRLNRGEPAAVRSTGVRTGK